MRINKADADLLYKYDQNKYKRKNMSIIRPILPAKAL